jgi:UDP-glucose:(heptosyl)LPS alpha-1,3-glucosyltransferase
LIFLAFYKAFFACRLTCKNYCEFNGWVCMGVRQRSKKLVVAVLIKNFISTGGSERYAVEVTRRLLEKGHRIDLYARVADRDLSAGMNHYQVPNRLKFSSVCNSICFAVDTARMLRGKSYDIIHSHERGYAQDILTVHTFCYKKGIEKYSLQRKIDQIYLSPRSGLYLWLERKQMKTPWLVAVSRPVQDDIWKYYRRKKGVSVITPGVDTSWFQPFRVAESREKVRRDEGILEGEMVILFMGSEFRRKGLDDLIPAIGNGMQLLIVGKGERDRHYRRLVRRCGVTDKVHFKGHSDNVTRYLAAADVVVLPSLSEAFGMSILEGMACGLPVVASANAGVSVLIENGFNGFTFHDPSELPGILRRLSDPAERRRLGEQARKTASEHTWKKAADKYENLYYQVVGEKRMAS